LETGTEQQEQQLQLLQGEVQHLQQDNVKVGAVGDRDRTAGATAAAAPGRGAAPTAGQCQGRSSWRQGQNSRSNSCSCSRERCSTYSRTISR